MDELRKVVPNAGSMCRKAISLNELQQSFWGPNYSRLLSVKAQYDPDACSSYTMAW